MAKMSPLDIHIHIHGSTELNDLKGTLMSLNEKIDALTAALDKEDLDDARLVREREEAIQALEEERAKGSVTQADLDKAEAAITQATERLGYNDLLDQSPGEEEPQENEAEDFRPDEEDSK